MTSMLVLVLFGATLAWLNRFAGTEPERPGQVPEDLWADFEAAAQILRATIAGPTTIGGLHIGAVGFVDSRAAGQHPDGFLTLDAAAIVFPTREDGRITVRRDAQGYHLQRQLGPVEVFAPDAVGRTSARVRVDSRFD